MLERILNAFGFTGCDIEVVPFGSGLINQTWKVDAGNKAFILQRINNAVLKKPEDIANKINVTSRYLHQKYPHYSFVKPLQTISNEDLFFSRGPWLLQAEPFG